MISITNLLHQKKELHKALKRITKEILQQQKRPTFATVKVNDMFCTYKKIIHKCDRKHNRPGFAIKFIVSHCGKEISHENLRPLPTKRRLCLSCFPLAK